MIPELHLESVVEDGLAGEADEAGGEGEPLHQLDLRRQDPAVDLVLAVAAVRVLVRWRSLQHDADELMKSDTLYIMQIHCRINRFGISCVYVPSCI